MKLEIAQKLVDANPDNLELRESYSGRGMFGKETAGVVCSGLTPLFEAIREAVEDIRKAMRRRTNTAPTSRETPTRRSHQRLVRHSWRDHDAMYVIGCIDANGAITANPSREGRTHRPEESKGKRWRWCVWSQEMAWGIPGRTLEEINNPRLNELTYEESFAVWDWLRKHGYTDDRSMPNIEDISDADTPDCNDRRYAIQDELRDFFDELCEIRTDSMGRDTIFY